MLLRNHRLELKNICLMQIPVPKQFVLISGCLFGPMFQQSKKHNRGFYYLGVSSRGRFWDTSRAHLVPFWRHLFVRLRGWPDLGVCIAGARSASLVSSGRGTVLHADDPFFLATSWGGMREILLITASWAHKHKVAFRVGAAKRVSLLHRRLNLGFVRRFPGHWCRPSDVMRSIAAQMVWATSAAKPHNAFPIRVVPNLTVN